MRGNLPLATNACEGRLTDTEAIHRQNKLYGTTEFFKSDILANLGVDGDWKRV